LKQSGHQSDDEEDEDDIEAHEASIQRLKARSVFLTHYSITDVLCFRKLTMPPDK
jgi:hypothetical protein